MLVSPVDEAERDSSNSGELGDGSVVTGSIHSSLELFSMIVHHYVLILAKKIHYMAYILYEGNIYGAQFLMEWNGSQTDKI